MGPAFGEIMLDEKMMNLNVGSGLDNIFKFTLTLGVEIWNLLRKQINDIN